MSLIDTIVSYFPIVKEPRSLLTFKDRLKNTIILLVLYFVLASIPIWGISAEVSERIKELSWIFGSSFGSLITLGIGPIVMAGIFLQLLVGGGIIRVNTQTPEGREKYNNYMRGLTLFFIVLESLAMLATRALSPDITLGIPISILYLIIFLQLFLGGVIIVLLDDYSLKYAITSGINLFILASISRALVMRFLNPLSPQEGQAPTGLLIIAAQQISQGNLTVGIGFILIVLATIGILALAAYLQAARVEVPILMARIGGQVMKFPIRILYTSVIPIILLYALIVELETLYRWVTHSNTVPLFLQRPAVIEKLITFGWSYYMDPIHILHIIVYLAIYIIGAAALSYLWVISSGMDARTIAQQLLSSPAFMLRLRDPRILERTLDKYIKPISILSGILIGVIAALSDIIGAALAGTSLLLLVVIAYNIYEDMVRNNVVHLLPAIGKMLSKKK